MGSPVKLGFFAKRDVLRRVPLMPSGATYGYISSGLAMPKGGACYVAAFDNPTNTSKAHIVHTSIGSVEHIRATNPSPKNRYATPT